MNIKHHRVLVPGEKKKKKPVFENSSLRCAGRLAQGAREPIKQDCNNPKTKPCLVEFQAFGGAGAGALRTAPWVLPDLPPARPEHDTTTRAIGTSLPGMRISPNPSPFPPALCLRPLFPAPSAKFIC